MTVMNEYRVQIAELYMYIYILLVLCRNHLNLPGAFLLASCFHSCHTNKNNNNNNLLKDVQRMIKKCSWHPTEWY